MYELMKSYDHLPQEYIYFHENMVDYSLRKPLVWKNSSNIVFMKENKFLRCFNFAWHLFIYILLCTFNEQRIFKKYVALISIFWAKPPIYAECKTCKISKNIINNVWSYSKYYLFLIVSQLFNWWWCPNLPFFAM